MGSDDAPVVGIDVARDRLDIHVHPSGANFAVDRTTEGVEQLCERLRLLKPKLVVLEATGGLEAIVARALTTWRLPAVIVNPAQVRAFAHALGRRAKTDRIDATVIARFAAATNPRVRARADAETAYSDEAGRGFRFEAGRHSEAKPATVPI
jgi:transposase